MNEQYRKKVIQWHDKIQNSCPDIKWEAIPDVKPEALNAYCKTNNCVCDFKNCCKLKNT